MKLTSSRWVNCILVGLFILTTLFFSLQFADHLLSRRYDAEEAKQREQREQRARQRQSWVIAGPPDKSFSVLMPRRPVLLTNFVRSPSGRLPTIQLGSTDGGRPNETETYIATFTEFPTNANLSDKEAIYDNAHATFADKLGRITVVAGLFAGCAATRPISDVALGAGGAYLGHEISNGDPLVTAAGAAGGVVVSETLHYAAKKQADKAYATGYDKGKSDAVKQQY